MTQALRSARLHWASATRRREPRRCHRWAGTPRQPGTSPRSSEWRAARVMCRGSGRWQRSWSWVTLWLS